MFERLALSSCGGDNRSRLEIEEMIDQQTQRGSWKLDLMRAIFVVEDLDTLYFRSRCQVCSQCALPFDSRPPLALDGQERIGHRGVGHRARQTGVVDGVIYSK